MPDSRFEKSLACRLCPGAGRWRRHQSLLSLAAQDLDTQTLERATRMGGVLVVSTDLGRFTQLSGQQISVLAQRYNPMRLLPTVAGERHDSLGMAF